MAKKAFDLSRNSIYVADPRVDLRIVGGSVLPVGERGPLDTDEGPEHELYDERLMQPLSEDFIANVDHYGVIEPIVICKLDDCAVVVAGRRRVRAARVANARRKLRGEPPITVECKMRKGDVMGVMLTENEAREDDDVVAKIAKFRRYLERGVSIEHAARAFGVAVHTAKGWIAFDDSATEETKAAVSAGKVSKSAAAEVARIKDPARQSAALAGTLAASTSKARATVHAARRAVRAVNPKSKDVGLSGKRTQQRVLDAVLAQAHSNAGPATLAWWQGVEDALKLVIGEDGVDPRLLAVVAKIAEGK